MAKTVHISVNGLDHYVFTAEGGTRVLSLYWNFYDQEWHPFQPEYHSNYTTYRNRCYDLRKPSNRKYFYANLGYFFDAITRTANLIKLGRSHPKSMTIDD